VYVIEAIPVNDLVHAADDSLVLYTGIPRNKPVTILDPGENSITSTKH
jgi:hypothetical protein